MLLEGLLGGSEMGEFLKGYMRKIVGWLRIGCGGRLYAQDGDSRGLAQACDKANVFSKRGTAVLEAPEERYASESGGPRTGRRLRRDASCAAISSRRLCGRSVLRMTMLRWDGGGAGVRVRFRGLAGDEVGKDLLPGVGVAGVPGVGVAAYLMARSYLLHDERFVIPSSSSIEIEGNAHVTRAQLLSIFGGDVERNIFTVSLAERRAELERLPWVAHATVMRLLPNRMRVSIVERTPVAFVRQGSHIGLVDANGVLLDMPVDAKASEHYSFPVVTGISANDPLSTRAARMKIFERFTTELDAVGREDLAGAERGGSVESGGCEGADSGSVDGDSGALWRGQFSGAVSADSRSIWRSGGRSIRSCRRWICGMSSRWCWRCSRDAVRWLRMRRPAAIECGATAEAALLHAEDRCAKAAVKPAAEAPLRRHARCEAMAKPAACDGAERSAAVPAKKSAAEGRRRMRRLRSTIRSRQSIRPATTQYHPTQVVQP